VSERQDEAAAGSRLTACHTAGMTYPGYLSLDVSMRIEEVPPREWADTLNKFTIAHEGWLVSMATIGSDMGPQTEIRNLPLIGISLNHGDDQDIAVSVARSAAEHVTHLIPHATRLYLERVSNGASASLIVESGERTRTILRARASAVPQHTPSTEQRL
jgi:uncharacterized protein DUF5335